MNNKIPIADLHSIYIQEINIDGSVRQKSFKIFYQCLPSRLRAAQVNIRVKRASSFR